MLWLVPTPIGHLEDITFRALEVLKVADIILAEDTRHSKKLLDHYAIKTPLKSYHAHNEHRSVPDIIQKLKSGVKMCLVTDAGTPGISDPGFLLVRACHQEGIAVSCLPGATAFVPALAASGLPCDKFYFEGFLPAKKGRKTRWQFLVQTGTTIVLYESPFRTLKCLKEIREYFGKDKMVCLAREISKLYEEIITRPVEELIKEMELRASIKGEIVIIISK